MIFICYIVFRSIKIIFESRAIYVDRFCHTKAVHAIKTSADTIIAKNTSVWVFPEGTRNHEGGMLAFKKGAFNIAVQVMAVDFFAVCFISNSNFLKIHSQR